MMKFVQAGAPHVLLVDDDVHQLRPLSDTLQKSSYRLTVAQGSIQGYAHAVSIEPDIILLAMRMRGRDGVSTVRMLKANPVTEHIPVLFLAGADVLDERLAGLRSGAVDYIPKPFYPEEIVERVRIHLSLAAGQSGSASTTSVADEVPAMSDLSANGQDKSHSDQVLQQAGARIIQERLTDPPRVSDLAAELAVSERRIVAAFKTSVGMSVFEFIRRERMGKAARLLLQTDLSMLDVVAEVGYSSAANFSTAFRKYWGRAPSSFRGGSIDTMNRTLQA